MSQKGDDDYDDNEDDNYDDDIKALICITNTLQQASI